MSAENNNSAMTTNQNHPDDHLAIEALHSRYL
ncbi:DUF550 domain-containing protein, partial [Pseudomonas aeruginosa]